MTEQDTTTKNVYWRYGLYGGLIIVVLSLVSNILGFENTSWLSMLIYILTIVVLGGVIFQGIKAQRDQVNHGIISTGQAFGTGFIIAFIVGLIGGVFTYFYFQFIDPAYIQEQLDSTMSEMAKQGMSGDELNTWEDYMGWFFNPLTFAIFGILSNLFLGAIISLISALILKRGAGPATEA